MKKLAIGSLLGLSMLNGNAIAANDWGCQVILCLSNPGGPTQYQACVQPISRLYKALRKGKPFPKCTGAGYSVSRPVYEPYTCERGRLHFGRDENGQRIATCQTARLLERPLNECDRDLRYPEGKREKANRMVCMRYEQFPPIVHEKPNRITVTIDGSGTQTIRY